MNSFNRLATIAECDFLPELWNDDEKMTAWFAPFRNRDLNPLNYDNKMAFWKKNIEYFCSQTNEIYFTLARIKSFFIRNGKLPACLTTVFESMINDGCIVKLTEYENPPSNDTWTSWALNRFVSTPLKWSYGMLTNSIIGKKSLEIDENIEYVHLASLQAQSENLRKLVLDDRGESLITLQDIRETVSEKNNMKCDLKSIKLMVNSLRSRGKADVVFNTLLKTHLVKFTYDPSSIPHINQFEVPILVLQTKEKLLLKEIQLLEAEKVELRTEIKKLSLKNMRTTAMNTLRKMKELEKRINKLVNVVENIQNLLNKVQDTETDTKILESYRIGARALKSGLTGGDLNMKAVDDAMDEIQEIFDMHNDIQETLSQTVGSIVTENELENELAELMTINDIPSPPSARLSTEPINEDLLLNDLPNVPRTKPESRPISV